MGKIETIKRYGDYWVVERPTKGNRSNFDVWYFDHHLVTVKTYIRAMQYIKQHKRG